MLLTEHLALRLVRVIACERVASIDTAIRKTRATTAPAVVTQGLVGQHQLPLPG